ncbi:MAG: 30S ribosomal protein S3 [Candidatus Pacebacteria bacterium CG_4_10_14_0_8_um_filter_42_14]|nr:MAG: 30S ribosomal protein S3 [Candidatus Pacebacteria bacterium CG_4_10_14_0_8_um_filter_42_14]
MGQKVNPIGFRLGNTFTSSSRWFSEKADYAKTVLEDHKLRQHLEKKLESAGIVDIIIERSLTKIKVTMAVSRPGVVIGKGGANLEDTKKDIERILNVSKSRKDKVKVDLRIEEIVKPDLSAKLVVERISNQLMKRYPHRRAVMQALERVMQAGAEGVKIVLSGRIGGAEIARTQKVSKGSVPTQTLRANIDYYEKGARTRSGYVGIKVWINKGEAR